MLCATVINPCTWNILSPCAHATCGSEIAWKQDSHPERATTTWQVHVECVWQARQSDLTVIQCDLTVHRKYPQFSMRLALHLLPNSAHEQFTSGMLLFTEGYGRVVMPHLPPPLLTTWQKLWEDRSGSCRFH